MAQHQATRDACVRETSSEGYFLVAKQDLPAGHVVYSGTAYAAALYEEFVEHVCARCFTISARTFTHSCSKCRRVFYCSHACQQAHAREGAAGAVAHKLVCEALQQLDQLEDIGSQVKVRLIFEVLARRHQMQAPKGQVLGSDDEVQDLLVIAPSSGWIYDEDSEAWCEGVRKAVRACTWGHAVPAAQITNNALLEIISKIDTNGFDCKTQETAGESIGVGLYLGGATLFNHSCDPTCEIVHDMPSLVVRTTRAVVADEPLTIAYVDVRSDRTTRRQRLRDDYAFDCECTRCVAEAAAADAPRPSAARGARSQVTLSGYLLAAGVAALGFWVAHEYVEAGPVYDVLRIVLGLWCAWWAWG